MKILVFDVETTGIPIWDKPSEDPGQPHICQYVAATFDSVSREETDYVAMILKPDGWVITPELTAIHGISQEYALAEGIPEVECARHFYKAAQAADRIVGYSVDFDIRMLRIVMKRAGIPDPRMDVFAEMVKGKKHDVMRVCTPLCKMPPTAKMMAAGRKNFKSPSLFEAVKILLKEDLGDAHDARADVLVTMRLYWHLNPS